MHYSDVKERSRKIENSIHCMAVLAPPTWSILKHDLLNYFFVIRYCAIFTSSQGNWSAAAREANSSMLSAMSSIIDCLRFL